MSKGYALTRNDTKEFARRVRKNLDFIVSKRREGDNVHEVTQLTTALLGLVVFPWEASALKHIEALSLADLEQQGWPHWNILQDRNGETTTLGKLTYHLRNAAAHRRVGFSSDEPDMKDVEIIFADALPKKPVDWRASIRASDLKDFCDLFAQQLEHLVE